MTTYLVEGGYPLEGSVAIHGAKNSVLPMLAACLLAPGECVIRNCPRLSDVEASLDILRHLGCPARREGDAVVVDASAPAACQEVVPKVRAICAVQNNGIYAKIPDKVSGFFYFLRRSL